MLGMLAVLTMAEVSLTVSPTCFWGAMCRDPVQPAGQHLQHQWGQGRDTAMVALPYPGSPQDFVPSVHHTRAQNQLLNPTQVLFAVKCTEHAGAGHAVTET